MASINDFKTVNAYTGTGNANGVLQLHHSINDDTGPVELENPNLNRRRNINTTNTFIPSNNKEEFNNDNIVDKSKRSIANLSTVIPERKPMGVDVKTSIEDDIFGKGGPFELYVENKKKEMLEINQLIDDYNEQLAINRGEEKPSDEEIQKIGTNNMTAAIIGTKYYDQSDGYGKYIGSIKKSPLEDKGLIKEDIDGTTNTNMSQDEEEDDMEKELNEELDNEFKASANNTDNNYITDEYTFDNIFEEDGRDDTNINENTMNTANTAIKDNNSTNNKVVKDNNSNIGINTDFSIDEEDIKDIEDTEDNINSIEDSVVIETVNEDDNMKRFQQSVTDKIKPIHNKLNLSGFTMIKQPIPISSTTLGKMKAKTAMNWALPNSGQYISMSRFAGREIESLGDNDGTNRFQTMKNRYQLLYDHVVSPKPKDLETWLKSISYADNDHLFFAVYGANFAGSNFVPYDCDKCKNTFLSDNIPLDNMYKFKDNDAKDKFLKIKDSQDNNIKPGLYVSKFIQLSDNIGIAFRDPSIWNIVFEISLLDDKFQTKYRDIIAVVSYIDSIYNIDSNTKSIQPIGYKIDTNNTVKTIKSRIITYAKILSTLSPDQYYIILAYINAINKKSDTITYIRPEVTCTNCNTIIPSKDTTAEELVFTRAQLATLSLTSIN